MKGHVLDNISRSITDIAQGLEGAARIAFALITPFLRSGRFTWGATPGEAARTLPGDELIPNPKWRYTHVVAIHAAPEAIWPWLLQMGDSRGGLYSYDFLENLAGCNMHSADHIVPELQDLKVGDSIKIHPRVPAWPVVALEPNHYILFHGDSRTDPPGPASQPKPDSFLLTNWLFYLDPVGARTTRLILRGQYGYSPDFNSAMGPAFLEPVSFVMERKMLLGIKKRAERR
jgi:hypothetical protein